MSIPNGNDYLMKVVVIGEPDAGKTSLLMRTTEGTFPQETASLQFDYKHKVIQVGSKTAKLQIWDTVGQERFRTITSSFYRGSQGVLVVFDVTSRRSFQKLGEWIEECKSYCTDTTPIFIVGNKVDKKNRTVTQEEAQKYADMWQTKYFETSAKDGRNVQAVFQQLGEQIVEGLAMNTIRRLSLIGTRPSFKVSAQKKKTFKANSCIIL